MKLEHIPNLLCVFRILLVGPLLWLLWQGRFDFALGLFFLAGFTDALDGFLAKQFDWRTQLGALLDPAADKLLLVTVFWMLALLGLLPFWVFALVVARDAIIVAGGVAYRVLIGPFRAGASPPSKLNTAAQLLLVLSVLSSQAVGFPPQAVLVVLGGAVVATTVVSGMDYVWTWGSRALQAHKQGGILMTENRFYVLIAAAVAGWIVYLLAPILTPFVAAGLIAYIGDPLVDRLERLRLPRSLAVLIVFLLIFLLLSLIVVLIVPLVRTQVGALVERLPGYVNWIESHFLPPLLSLLGIKGGPDTGVGLAALLSQYGDRLGSLATNAVATVSRSGTALLAGVANLILIPVLTFYVLRDWDVIVARTSALLPADRRDRILDLAGRTDEVLGGFLRGQVTVMFALAVIYTVGLWLIGLDFFLAIGVVAGLVSFVPYLGFIVGAGLAGLSALAQMQSLIAVLGVVAVFGFGQLLESTVLTPRLVGDRIGLHPVMVIFAVMAGGQLFGFFGVLLALPAAAALSVLVRFTWEHYRTPGNAEAAD